MLPKKEAFRFWWRSEFLRILDYHSAFFYHLDIAALFSPLHLAGGSTIVSRSLGSLTASSYNRNTYYCYHYNIITVILIIIMVYCIAKKL